MLSNQNLNLTTNQKFKPRFVGPLKVTKRIRTQAYQVELPVALSKFLMLLMYHYCKSTLLEAMGLVQYSQLSWMGRQNGK